MLRWGVLGLAATVALIAWLVTRGDDPPGLVSHGTAARIVSSAELREAEVELGRPIYWAGPLPGKELELEELGEAGVLVRYLPEGTAAGERSAKVLAIGSYPLPDPEAALRSLAARKGSLVRRPRGGSPIVVNRSAPGSAYLTDPRNEVQIEVHDPSLQRAISLARSGRLRPAG
jgi:hypothetical protein